jgi:hypothetical protein
MSDKSRSMVAQHSRIQALLDYNPSYSQIRDVTALGRKESPNIHRSSRTFCTEYMGYDRKGMPVSRPYAPCTPTVGRVI